MIVDITPATSRRSRTRTSPPMACTTRSTRTSCSRSRRLAWIDPVDRSEEAAEKRRAPARRAQIRNTDRSLYVTPSRPRAWPAGCVGTATFFISLSATATATTASTRSGRLQYYCATTHLPAELDEIRMGWRCVTRADGRRAATARDEAVAFSRGRASCSRCGPAALTCGDHVDRRSRRAARRRSGRNPLQYPRA